MARDDQQWGTQVTVNLQFTKGTAIVAGETVATLPAGFRPPTLVVAPGFTTTGSNVGTVQFQIAATGVITINYVQAAAASSAWLRSYSRPCSARRGPITADPSAAKAAAQRGVVV